MRTLLVPLTAATWCLASSATPMALAGDASVPSAREVVERHADDLGAALRIALRPALEAGDREVAIVLDVTPYTQASSEQIVSALLSLETLDSDVPAWRIAPLGGRFGEPTARPTGLVLQLGDVLAAPTPSSNTLVDLRRTLSRFDARDGVVVYLADWHVEDDHDLERLIDSLQRRGQTFGVIGSEAAFTRGWNDGLFAGASGSSDPRGGGGSYDPQIGRDPFGRRDPVKPWHGGETGYPHLPYAFLSLRWTTEFSPDDTYALESANAEADGEMDERELEDLRERLENLRRDDRHGRRGVHPLPSGWGPYGLMRTAAVTGGRYVLWSWNPDGRSDVRYDYARLDLFPPDLRPRSVLLSEIRSRPLARALMEAWHLVAQPRAAIASMTPPVEDDLRTPQQIGETEAARCLACDWVDRADVRQHRRVVGRTLEGMDAAIARLDRALAEAGSTRDDVDRRLAADADLLRHTLLSLRFSLGEIDAVNRLVPMDSWDRPDVYPLAAPTDFLLRGDDPESVKPRTAVTFDPERATQLVEDRKRMLARYRDTPWAATIARNPVFAYRLAWGIRVPADPAGGGGARNPSESVDAGAEQTPTGGGSSGTGASGTGR